MSARIVAQIEALIARLSAAREILASLQHDTETPATDVRVLTMQTRDPDTAPNPEPAPAARRDAAVPVQVTVLKPRGRRERRTVTRPAPAPTATALGGQIPQRPVAVSPLELAQARERRAAEDTPDAAPRSALDELMQEIAQRSA